MRKTRVIKIGNIFLGGNNPIRVQSMTKTPTTDVKRTLMQIYRLSKRGCELVRLAIPDKESAIALDEIKKKSPIPIIADIHFDYRLALIALEKGADKIRINPGNIKNPKYISLIAKEAMERKIPIRVGINSGSLSEDILKKYGGVTPEALVDFALTQVKLLEDEGFRDIVISVKAPSIPITVNAYRILSKKVEYPLHIGITEAGTLLTGSIRSSIGIGILLYEGIGDTIRVSLSTNPEKEVDVAYEILRSLGLRDRGVKIISCPMCARTSFPVERVAKILENEFKNYPINITIAVMGCEVNGPGEAKYAHFGITGIKDKVFLFKYGKIIKEDSLDNILEELKLELEKLKKEVNSN